MRGRVAEHGQAFRALHGNELQAPRFMDGSMKVDETAVQLRGDAEAERFLVLLVEQRSQRGAGLRLEPAAIDLDLNQRLGIPVTLGGGGGR